MALHKALEYAVRYWPCAMGALDDGRLPLDNNLTERSIKPFVIDRKRLQFGDMHSIMVMVKMNSLNPRNYVHWLLEEIPIVDNPGEPDLPRLSDAVAGIHVHRHKAEAGSGRGGRQDDRRPDI